MMFTNLPPLPADMLADMRKLAGSQLPPAKPMSFDISVGKKSSKQRPLSSQECIELFGTAVAVKMNFIPQMMTALVMQKTIDFINFCIEHRLSEFKKHTRALRRCVEEFTQRLYRYYGEAAYRSYLYYAERYMGIVSTDVYMMTLNLQEAAANQIPGKKYREIAAMLSFIVLVVRYCDKYDSEMDKVIESKIGAPVHQRRDVCVHCILGLCIDIAEKRGYKLNIPDNAMMWVKILSNRAFNLADTIISEENVT